MSQGLCGSSPCTVIGIPACTVRPFYQIILVLQISRGELLPGQEGQRPWRSQNKAASGSEHHDPMLSRCAAPRLGRAHFWVAAQPVRRNGAFLRLCSGAVWAKGGPMYAATGLLTHRLCRSQMFSRLVETGRARQPDRTYQGRYPQFSAEETGRSVSLNVSLWKRRLALR